MTGQTGTVAPEIKTVPETMTAAFDEFMGAFEVFKETNDRRLGEIETKLTADVVTRDKMDRISAAMDEQKRALDQLVLKKARPALGRSETTSIETIEHKAAFENYIRKGDETALRDLEGKAFSIGSSADGGYLVPNETDTEIGRRLSTVSPIRNFTTGPAAHSSSPGSRMGRCALSRPGPSWRPPAARRARLFRRRRWAAMRPRVLRQSCT